MRKFYLFFSILILFSCSTEESDQDPIEPVTEQGSEEEGSGPEEGEEGEEVNEGFTYFKFPGNNQLDFSKLRILSEEQSSAVQPDGSFEDLEKATHIDFNLVLYEEAVLAYYPGLIVSNKIDLTNLMVFYFANIPLLSFYDLDKKDIYDLIENNSYRAQLHDEFQKSLNNGKNPLNNPSFLEVFINAATAIAEEIDDNFNTRGHIGDFSLAYYRNGEISIPPTSPIGTVLGIEIINDFGSLLQEGIYIAKPNLPLALESFLKKINYTALFPDESPKTVSLFNGGLYQINISNGRLINDPNDAVIKKYNEVLLGAYNLYFAAKFVGDIDEFAQIESDLHNLLESRGTELSNSELEASAENYKENFNKTLSKTMDVLDAKLNLEPNFLSETKRLLGGIWETISDVENFVEWTVIDSTVKAYINHSENQYFNYVNPFALHGELEYQNLTELIFDAAPNEIVDFALSVKEKEIGYEIGRQGWGKSLKPMEVWQPAFQIPFTYSLMEGDANITSANPLFTDNDGRISLKITAGTQNSKIKLTPLIGNSDIPEQIIEIENSETPKTFWKGSMQLTDAEGLEPCQVDRNNDGALDYGVDCGTGGCQSCTRALFGSSWGTSATIEYAFSNVIGENNFKVGATVGGNSTAYVVYCYTSNITTNDDEFTVLINHYAPRGLSSADSKLQEVNFIITERSSNSIKGTWSGKILAAEDHCLEECSGTWQVTSIDEFLTECDREPENP